jgi:hypothetical protein
MPYKIGFFTPYRLNPMHPRIKAHLEFFSKNNIPVNIYQAPIVNSRRNYLNWITLNFFDLHAVMKLIPRIGDVDVVFLQDMKYLPLAVFAKLKGKTVIYESLDNNVHLRFYFLAVRRSWFKYLSFIKVILEYLEKYLVNNFVNECIVNSIALRNYFGAKARLIYYYSFLEQVVNDSYGCDKDVELLYIGVYKEMKGAREILEFVEESKLKCLVLGWIAEQGLKDKMVKSKYFRIIENLNEMELKNILEEEAGKYNLVGLSLTKSVNKSNELQELNKDIDYLAMGIPILGNRRPLTAEKIEAGCGVYINDDVAVDRLLTDYIYAKTMSSTCRKLYKEKYSKTQYEKHMFELLNVIEMSK